MKSIKNSGERLRMRAESGMESFLVSPEGAGGVGGFAGMKSAGSAQTVA